MNTDNSVKIEIQDTGKGIEHDRIKDLFRPFFTTKAQGTGLGLAVTKRFIEQNRGKISVESAPNKGTTFSIYLPVNGFKKVTNA